MTTGSFPLPNLNYITPIGGFWYSSAPGILTVVTFPTTMMMSSPPNLTMPIVTNTAIIPLNTYTPNNIAEEIYEPMHQLQPEKPMDHEVEKEYLQRLENGLKEHKNEIKLEIEEDIDYSDMPQLTRMDC